MVTTLFWLCSQSPDSLAPQLIQTSKVSHQSRTFFLYMNRWTRKYVVLMNWPPIHWYLDLEVGLFKPFICNVTTFSRLIKRWIFLCQTSLESNVKSDVFRVDARERGQVFLSWIDVVLENFLYLKNTCVQHLKWLDSHYEFYFSSRMSRFDCSMSSYRTLTEDPLRRHFASPLDASRRIVLGVASLN